MRLSRARLVLALFPLTVAPIACSSGTGGSHPARDATVADVAAHDAAVHDAAASDVAIFDAPVADTDAALEASVGDTSSGDGAASDASDAATAPRTYPGFTLVLDEEFEVPLDLDHDPIWTWGDGVAAPSMSRFVKEGLSFSNGQLVITETAPPAPVASSPSHSQPAWQMATGVMPAEPYASGELRTRYNNYRYGRYEARLTFSPSRSNPQQRQATFSVDRQPRWQHWNEIDLQLYSTLPHSIVSEVVNLHDTTFFLAELNNAQPVGPTFTSSEAHDYALTWLPNRIDWSVDGVVVKSSTSADLVVPDQSAKIRLNLWTTIYGPFQFEGYPVSMTVDYVRFYKWDQEATYPCATPPTCLPADDLDYAGNNPNDPAVTPSP